MVIKGWVGGWIYREEKCAKEASCALLAMIGYCVRVCGWVGGWVWVVYCVVDLL